MDTRTDAAHAAVSVRWTPRQVWALVLVCLASLIELVDITIVNAALPAIRDGLHGATKENIAWVIVAYLITFGGFMLVGGRLGDNFGHRRTFMIGLGVFTVASAACGIALDIEFLVAARAFQGLAAAVLAPMTLALITDIFPAGAGRAKAITIWSATGAISTSLGVTLGGLLSDGPGWRWVFLVTVPIGLVVLALTPWVVRVGRSERRPGSFDVVGALLVTLGVTVTVYAIAETDTHAWGSVRVLSLLAAAAALLLYAAVHEAFIAAEPLVPLPLIASRTVIGASLVAAVGCAGFYALFHLLSLYMQTALGYSALRTGLLMLPVTSVGILSALLVPTILAALGARWAVVLGGVLGGSGMLLVAAGVAADGVWLHVVAPAVLVAVATPLWFITVSIVVVAGVNQSDTGLISGLLTVCRTVGGAVGIAVVASVLTARPGTDGAAALLSTEATQRAFVVASGMYAAFVLAAILLLGNEGRDRRGVTAP
ncbi:MFS transporter [Nocardia mexicana]|uniref:EmrB/QacA subfamily drug resistance transporter n=1 Tax=Nocardia mexicana TaxID=279262 RepID=A0A370HEB0_9NOCA|nr:MFS transporter [Nocardia mexicana]RDI55563.1 EmrB/QacA subfamily drug resistance transporter [Nocardia mexicana]